MATTTPATTNKEVGRRIGFHHTTISRLRSGTRMPSTVLLNRLCTEYGLDRAEAMAALDDDQKRGDGQATTFAAYLREHVFGEAA